MLCKKCNRVLKPWETVCPVCDRWVPIDTDFERVTFWQGLKNIWHDLKNQVRKIGDPGSLL